MTLGGSGGVLAGIARRPFSRAPMEVLDHVPVTVERGIEGDYRGVVRPGGKGRRQVTLMERGDWEAATAELDRTIPWQERRVNLLVDGLDLPQVIGARVRIGSDVLVSITGECDPCSRMERVCPGLEAALTPDWRGGVLSRVLVGGAIRVGDIVQLIEEPS